MPSIVPHANGAPQSNSGPPRSLLERLSTPPPEPLESPMATDNSASDADSRGFEEWQQSLGSLFRHSHDRARDHRELHCAVEVRGGDELRFHSDAQPRVIRHPPAVEHRAGGGYSVDLLNRIVEPPRPELGSLDVPLSPGQLVWKVTHVSHARGRSQVLDTNGPYIIVERDHTHYVLLTREGKIYDFLVPAHCLYPCTTTWHVVDLPRSLVNHPDVANVMNSFDRA